MTTELQMLVWSALLLVVQSFSVLFGGLAANGVGWGIGNRGESRPLPAWGERAVRAHRNMIENLVPFAALVLTAHAAGVSNAATAGGAAAFFWGRLAFAGVYIAGIPYLRTAVFVVAIGGMLAIARALLSA